jgi:hypothetical protein
VNPPAVVIDLILALMREQLSGFKGYPTTDLGERNFARRVQDVAISAEHAAAIFMSFDVEFPTAREIQDVAMNLLPKFQPKDRTYAEWEKEYGKPQKFDLDPPDRQAMHWQAIRDALYYTEGPGRLKMAGKEQQYWEEALRLDTRDWADSVIDVRAEVDTYGWDEMMNRAVPFGGFELKRKNHNMWSDLKKYFIAIYLERGQLFPGWAKITWRQIFEAMPQLGYPLNREQEKMLGM